MSWATTWTPQQVQTVLNEYVLGDLTARATGKMIGKTRNQVIGLAFRRWGGVGENRKPPALQIPWLLEDDERARRLKLNGHSTTAIAVVLGVKRRWLAEKLKQPPMLRPQPVPDFNLPRTDFISQCMEKDCRHTKQPGRVLCAEHLTLENNRQREAVG